MEIPDQVYDEAMRWGIGPAGHALISYVYRHGKLDTTQANVVIDQTKRSLLRALHIHNQAFDRAVKELEEAGIVTTAVPTHAGDGAHLSMPWPFSIDPPPERPDFTGDDPDEGGYRSVVNPTIIPIAPDAPHPTENPTEPAPTGAQATINGDGDPSLSPISTHTHARARARRHEHPPRAHTQSAIERLRELGYIDPATLLDQYGIEEVTQMIDEMEQATTHPGCLACLFEEWNNPAGLLRRLMGQRYPGKTRRRRE